VSLARRSRLALELLPPQPWQGPIPVPLPKARRARLALPRETLAASAPSPGQETATQAALSALVDTLRAGPTRTRRQGIVPGAS